MGSKRVKGFMPPIEGFLALILIVFIGVSVVVLNLAHYVFGKDINVEVNIRRKYKPLLVENTLQILLNSEISRIGTSKLMRYHLYYQEDPVEVDFKKKNKRKEDLQTIELGKNLENYLENLTYNYEYSLLVGTKNYEKKVGAKVPPGLESSLNFILPNLNEGNITLFLESEGVSCENNPSGCQEFLNCPTKIENMQVCDCDEECEHICSCKKNPCQEDKRGVCFGYKR